MIPSTALRNRQASSTAHPTAPMRKRKQITNETQKQPLTPEAKELRDAIVLTKPTVIEQVILLSSDGIDVEHEANTNEYKIAFPETWRTITNAELYISVRSINLRNKTHVYSWVMDYEIHRPDNGTPISIYSINWRREYRDGELPDFREWVDEWSKIIDEIYDLIIPQYEDYDFKWDRHKFFYFENRDGEPHFELGVADARGYYDITTLSSKSVGWKFKFTEISPDLQELGWRAYYTNWKHGHTETDTVSISLNYQESSHTTYLLGASFASQTKNNYLGFTNTVFNPPKTYKLNAADKDFSIYLYSPNGKEEIELPNNASDFITIELQLTAEPIATRL